MESLVGQKFNALRVLECLGIRHRFKMYRCVCDCGEKTVVRSTYLRTGHTKSCGCLTHEKHSHAKRGKHSPTYISWRAMQARCLNPNHGAFKNYSGRGITIDPLWVGRNGFLNFLRDMGVRPFGTTLDRKRVNGNYEKSNCRWADWKTQGSNKRHSDHLLKAA
jgi:hypothetical protein